MKIFINEESLQGQFHNRQDFVNAIKELISIFNYLKQLNVFRFYKKEDISNKQAIQSEVLQASLNSLPADLRTFYKDIIYNKTNPINWDSQQVHTCCYTLNNHQVTNTTIAEFAERKIQDESCCFLLNYSSLTLTGLQMIKKNFENFCEVNFQNKLEEVTKFIESNDLCQKYIYTNYSSKPQDEQTFLRDKTKFSPTYAKFQSRIVYKCIDGYYWYVDNKHQGKTAHIEVFGKDLKHIGTSLIAVKDVKSSYKKQNRDIKDLKDQLNKKSS